jgi:hypothetical protein
LLAGALKQHFAVTFTPVTINFSVDTFLLPQCCTRNDNAGNETRLPIAVNICLHVSMNVNKKPPEVYLFLFLSFFYSLIAIRMSGREINAMKPEMKIVLN